MEVGIVFRIYLENIMTITSNNEGRATALPFFILGVDPNTVRVYKE